MLAFSSIVFFNSSSDLQNNGQLATHLRVAFQSLKHCFDNEWSRVTIWLIFVIRQSVPDGFGGCLWLVTPLLEASKMLGLQNWAEARQILKSFLWVDAMGDDFGESLWNSVIGVKDAYSFIHEN
jgi:hypothetical protein